MRRYWQFVAIPLVIVVLLFAAARLLDFETLRETLRSARWEFLIPSTILNVITVGVIVLRWRTLLGGRARYQDCLAANQIGAYMNLLVPLRMGDFTRSYILRRHAPALSMVAILSSIGAELTFDMAVLMVLLGLVLLLLPLPPLLTSAGAVLAVLTIIAAGSVFALGRSEKFADRAVRPLLEKLPGRLSELALEFMERAQDGLSSLRSNKQFLVILALTLLGYSLQIVSNTLLLHAFLPDADLQAGLLALVGSGLGLALPLLPGSTGTYQVAVTLALTSLGIEAEVAAAFAVILHAQQFAITLVMGSLATAREGVSLRELRKAAEVPDTATS
jgi:uncharacterized protein (TIRG00374 family)